MSSAKKEEKSVAKETVNNKVNVLSIWLSIYYYVSKTEITLLQRSLFRYYLSAFYICIFFIYLSRHRRS